MRERDTFYKDGPVTLTQEQYMELYNMDRTSKAGKLAMKEAGIDQQSDMAPISLTRSDGTVLSELMVTDERDFGTFLEDPSHR